LQLAYSNLSGVFASAKRAALRALAAFVIEGTPEAWKALDMGTPLNYTIQ
jgi:hypothetical protein